MRATKFLRFGKSALVLSAYICPILSISFLDTLGIVPLFQAALTPWWHLGIPTGNCPGQFSVGDFFTGKFAGECPVGIVRGQVCGKNSGGGIFHGWVNFVTEEMSGTPFECPGVIRSGCLGPYANNLNLYVQRLW